MRPPPGSWIEIDADALTHNVKALQAELAPARMVMVIKADAYGHGVDTVVPIAEAAGVREFAVFSANEASRVRDATTTSRVQVMGHVGDWAWAAQNRVEPWLNDVAEWPRALAAAEAHVKSGGAPMAIHIEVETGMHRTGLLPDNALTILTEAQQTDAIQVRGLCTHLAGAEDERNLPRIREQMATFAELTDRIKAAGIRVPLCHVASSSAAIAEPQWRLDVVRVGIAAYGMWPTPEVRARYDRNPRAAALQLRRCLTWKSRVLAIQDVPAGDFVGYGTSSQAIRDTRIAVVPVGYGDGLSRSVAHSGGLLVGGQRCPVMGPVNMNMVQLDVGHLDDVQPGDEVVLIGSQGDAEIGVHSFAESQEVVNYELMARLSRDLPRIVKQDAPAA